MTEWLASDLNPMLAGSVALTIWVLLAPHGHRAAKQLRQRRPGERRWASTARALRARGRTANRLDKNVVRVLVAQVAALLRAGAPPSAAWTRAADVRVDALGVPDETRLVALVGARSARALVAATRLALTLGAPLAPVLGATSAALSTQADADAERATALAGPRTTARVLLWLPVAGLALGWLLGVDPVATVTDRGLGTFSVALGGSFLLLGRWWINRLINAAQRAGGDAGAAR